MPIPLIQPLIDEKNKISQDQPWLILLKLTNVAGDLVLRLVRNTENITYKGEEYIAFPFEVDTIPEATQGSIASFNINVSNVDRQIQNYIEQDATFGSGWEIIMSVIHTSDLNPSAPSGEVAEIEQVWKSLSITADNETLAISVGMPNPMNIQVPSQKFSGGFCQRTFNDGVGCPYSSQVAIPEAIYETENTSLDNDNYTYKDGTNILISSSSININMLTLPETFNSLNASKDIIWVSEGDLTSKVTTPEFVQIKYSRSLILNSVTIDFLNVVRSVDNAQGLIATPRRFKIQGSEDGESWILLKQVNSTTPLDTTFVMDVLQPFKYFRFLFDETIYHDYSNYTNQISHYLQGGETVGVLVTEYEYRRWFYDNNEGWFLGDYKTLWTESSTSYPPLDGDNPNKLRESYKLTGRTRQKQVGTEYVPPIPNSSNISTFGLQITNIKATQDLAYTSCNKTIANCKARFSTKRVNSKGEKIGLPYLAFNGMEVRAIYDS